MMIKNNEQTRNLQINHYEEIAMNAFPAIQSELYDGWVLRYTGGYTFRGNSVNPIYQGNINLEEKVLECERRYLEQGLPSVFKISEAVEEGLDLFLDHCGYAIKKKADIMTRELNDEIDNNLILNEGDLVDQVTIDYSITEDWLDEFVMLNGTNEEPMKSIAKEVLRKIQNPIFCASIKKDGEMVACGLGVFENGKIGLFDIRVLKPYRRLGLGAKICSKIMLEGIKQGAIKAYLQVAVENEGAIKL
ncbi:GNAT family N-acetyltransferase, partial [Anaerosporobacter sp.]